MGPIAVTSLIPFVESELSFDHSGHGIQHAMRVLANGRKIAENEGGDLPVIEAACLVHDVIDEKLFQDVDGQIAKVRNELSSLGFSSEQLEAVLSIIQTISYRKGNEKPLTSLEAKIVRDADRLDALGAIGVVRTIEYGASRGRPFYVEEDLRENGGHETDLSHFYDKLLKLEGLMCTETGKRLAKKRSEFLKSFLDEFYSEVAD